MNRKTVAMIAVLMLIVFGATILLYPTLYSPEMNTAPIEAPPVDLPN